MLNDPVYTLKGIGKVAASAMDKLNIHTVGDLLEHYPLRYEDRSRIKKIGELQNGEFASFAAEVTKGELQRTRGKVIARLWVKDETGIAVLTWFNQPYRTKSWKPGSLIMVYGKVNYFRNEVQVETPEVDCYSDGQLLNLGRIVPIYPLTEGIGPRILRKAIASALNVLGMEDPLPESIRQMHSLLDRKAAFQEIHFPSEWQSMTRAKQRIVFEELFWLQCALVYLRTIRVNDRRSMAHAPDGSRVRALLEKFPFQLTSGQLEAYNEIRSDMERTRPMLRLLQGDVGSGKTAVALLALTKTIENGLQGALMAPTEILAEQHFRVCADYLDPLGIRIALLTGRVKGKARTDVMQGLKNGTLDLIVGTHALLQPEVKFACLGLVVTDEQHRFGVGQRAILQEKGEAPHTLVMSATPIPRTMALTLYGDMEISAIRQMPPGRQPVVTAVRSGTQARERVYRYLKEEVLAGRQGYIVCPLVEESDKIDAQSAISVFAELTSTYLQDVACALLHGRMNPAEKEAVMRDFVNGNTSVLVATTVIEVGINVPRATMMIVENADRFGLAQLHQLRGRVGRGADRAYCVLLHNDDFGSIPERLRLLAQTCDGFEVAEKDLAIRGPGLFLGYRQHGLPEMKMANLADDLKILEEARRAGISAMNDPQESIQIKSVLQHRYERFFGVLFAG